MRRLGLTKVGAVCAVVTVAMFVVGVAFMATSGVQVLIPETGEEGIAWIGDVDAADWRFFVGAWIVVFAGLVGIVALVGFYAAFREAGPAMVLAPILGAVGLTLVTISHVLPLAMAYELVPGYRGADAATQESLAVVTDTLASLCLVLNYTGNALNWGVVVPLYAYAILATGAIPRWIGWVGFVAAVFGGWLGLLGPASSAIEGITTIGFFAFFVFMLSTGIALLRRRPGAAEEPLPTTAP